MMSGFAYVYNFIIRMSFSASNIIVTVAVPRVCVCVCVSVRGFLPPRASRPQNFVGTYVFTATRKTLLYIIIVIFDENASFRSYGIICLPRMPLTSYFGATTYGYQRNPRNMGMTLLFAVLTKNDSFRSYSTFVYLLRAHILNINTCKYTTSAHGHELSGCVRADAYNLILIFAS